MFLTRDKDALQNRIQGACKWRKWLRHARAFPVGLTTYGSLAVDDDRCVSNEIGCLAHGYYDVFTIPCAFFFSCYFAPSQTCEPNLDSARPRSCSDDSWRCLCSHHLSKRFSNNCRALKLFHVPSTTHAALPGRTFNKNHWHETTNLAAHILRHYFNMCVESLKCNTLRVLEIPR